jgi:transposase
MMDAKGSSVSAARSNAEHAFARLGRWRRLSRCYEGTSASARAWLEVAAPAYLFARLRVEPP